MGGFDHRGLGGWGGGHGVRVSVGENNQSFPVYPHFFSLNFLFSSDSLRLIFYFLDLFI